MEQSPGDLARYLAYAGTPTFWRLDQTRDLSNVDIAVMGIPFDLGTSNRPGARFGPRAIRDISLHTGNFHYPWSFDLKERLRLIDYGDVGGGVQTDLTNFMIQDAYEHAGTIFAAGAKLLTLGGDHTIPYGLIRAAKDKHGPISLVHFDSHQDSESSNGGRSIFHGSFAHDLAEEGTVDPSRSAQVFIRTDMENPGYQIIHANEALYLSPKELAERIRAVVGTNPVYITFDIDALDPAYAPGTGTPVVGGPTTFFAREVLRNLLGLNVVAADVVEVLPALDPSAITALAAATIGVDLLYLMAGETGTDGR
ncbi:agmatinase [Sphingomonas sp. CFBP 13728]|uniref:agmatinase n=1 Tax=Sphingomonas sp. CFBP 13728 TaxID=2775294 RepID=UPI00177F908D|nr:agmatinase [Sphingomonas sp. CFBP 13728]MBD8620438.1 agmatinase [Sphingomonas sp. CFBP 13728]